MRGGSPRADLALFLLWACTKSPSGRKPCTEESDRRDLASRGRAAFACQRRCTIRYASVVGPSSSSSSRPPPPRRDRERHVRGGRSARVLRVSPTAPRLDRPRPTELRATPSRSSTGKRPVRTRATLRPRDRSSTTTSRRSSRRSALRARSPTLARRATARRSSSSGATVTTHSMGGPPPPKRASTTASRPRVFARTSYPPRRTSRST